MVELHDAAGRVQQGDAGERGDGASQEPVGVVGGERGSDQLRGVRRYGEQQRVRHELGECRHGDKRHVAGRGPGVRHGLLLAGAGPVRGRRHAGRQRRPGGTSGRRWSSRTRSASPGRPTGRRRSRRTRRCHGGSPPGPRATSIARHDERRCLRRDVDEHRHGPERRAERADRRHHVLLACARGECRRHDVCGGQHDGLLELRDGAGGVQQGVADEHDGGGDAGPDADVGGKRGRDQLRGTATTRRSTACAAGAGRTSATSRAWR